MKMSNGKVFIEQRQIFFASLLLALFMNYGCNKSINSLPQSCPRGKPIVSARAINAQQVQVNFACMLDAESATGSKNYTIRDFSTTTTDTLTVEHSSVAGGQVTLTTASQTALVTYTLEISGIKDVDGNVLQGSVNFVGVGQSKAAEITLQVDDRYNANLKSVWVLVSVDPLTGVFIHNSQRIALADPEEDHIFEATLKVAVDPTRTINTNDDRMGSQYMAYSVRAVDEQDSPLSELILFEVQNEELQTVKVPLLSVPKPHPPEGVVTVSFKVDDRPAQALSAPSLRASFDTEGKFDSDFPAIIPLTDDNGDNIWEGIAKVRIDPDRIMGGTTSTTKPYSAYLVDGETPYSARSADFAVPDEKSVNVSLLVGSKDKVPVTFYVDVSQAWLRPDGSQKRLYPGEAVFLTGEFAVAEDAFGQNAADAFSGGENVVLQMEERKDLPGVWQRTLFLPQNRPCSWKVVRCPKNKGCSQLNKMVVSSGRAFPTVMKNLITELCDAGKSKGWTDPNCRGPKVIDPRHLEKVDTGVNGVLDYSKTAAVFKGTNSGLKDQKDPDNTPNPSMMFKQEIPDLVVEVKNKPLQTPVYVIGAWRDVNLDGSPADIIASGQVLDLAKTDYDQGLMGAAPPSYTPPVGPKSDSFKMDGQLDKSAKLIAGNINNTLPLYLALNGNYLYLATGHARDGYDRFLFISADPPGTLKPAPWAKAGQVAWGGGKALFMASENDNNFAGWFELGATGSDDKLLERSEDNEKNSDLNIMKPPSGPGVVEGLINLAALFGQQPTVLYITVAPWANADKGTLNSSAQTPPSKDGNGDIEENEILKVSLPSLQVLP